MLLRIINILAFGLMVAVNYLANALPINGKTTGQLSDQYPNLFVPAGITFSIWGVIYLLLLAFCFLQFSQHQKNYVHSIGWAFALSCLFNVLWILSWHFERLPLSMCIMLGLLVTLIYINIQMKDAPAGLMKASFGIYLGWICIATIANATALLVYFGWGGFGLSPQFWSMIMIAAGTIIALLSLTSFRNPYLGLAVIWALAGIIIKRQTDFQSIVVVAIIGIAFLTVASIIVFLRKA